jgi:rubredoxin
MKQCPDCETNNHRTNLFCPTCGHSFIDEKGPDPKHSHINNGREIPGVDRPHLFVPIVFMVVILGLAAGLCAFLISRSIGLGDLVSVQSGTRWKCTNCGRIYKERVVTVKVNKSEQYDYDVETLPGLCFTCKYGNLVGGYQDLVEELCKKKYYQGYLMDIPDGAASFIAANPSLFPSAGPPAGVQVVDPQQVERKFDQYLGKLIVVKGKVLASKPVVTANGTRATYVGLQNAAPKGREQSEFFIVYKGPGRFARDSTAKAYILPVDLVPYNPGARQAKAVLGIGMYVEDQPRVPASTTPVQ